MRITSARYWRGHSLVKKIYLAASLLVLMPLLFTLRYIVLEPAVVSIPPAVVSIPPDLQRVLSGLSPDTQQYILQYKNICETQSTQPNRVLLELREQRVGTNQSLHTLLQSFFTGPSNHPTNMAPHTVADTKVHASPTFASRACPCLPLEKAPCSTDSLYKYMRLTWTNIEVLNTDVHVGGEWMPTHCAPRQRIAIIIPYRSREQHLKVFMATMHPFLQRQHLHYQLFVIEQHAPAIFNRASLLNVGFLEARKHGAFDCYIYHDVDLLPESDLNLYTCFKTPLHIGAYMNKFEYRMPYNNFFGGAMALTGPQMELINGFPNNFYGWGGEDDDIYERVMFHNLTVEKHPLEIGKTYMLKHNHDRLNPENPLRLITQSYGCYGNMRLWLLEHMQFQTHFEEK